MLHDEVWRPEKKTHSAYIYVYIYIDTSSMFLLSMNLCITLPWHPCWESYHRFSGFSLWKAMSQNTTLCWWFPWTTQYGVKIRNRSETMRGWYMYTYIYHKQISQMWKKYTLTWMIRDWHGFTTVFEYTVFPNVGKYTLTWMIWDLLQYLGILISVMKSVMAFTAISCLESSQHWPYMYIWIGGSS